MKTIVPLVSCEHAVNTVPPRYQNLFVSHQALLQTHHAIDFGAQEIAVLLNQNLNCDFVQAQATRLLIDCNRSLGHRNCFSMITSPLSQEMKAEIIRHYYSPFRAQVEETITKHIQQQKFVLHLSIHSFTPFLNNTKRNADLGLLYDPKRTNEKRLAKRWQQQLQQRNSKLKVRMNYPYLGISDGFTTALRKKFSNGDYAGIEVEINQQLAIDANFMRLLGDLLTQTLRQLIQINNSDCQI